MNPDELFPALLRPEHIIIAPILIPLIAGAVMLFYEDRQRQAKLVISLIAAVAMLFVSIHLLNETKGTGPSGGTDVGLYLLGDWPTPYAIVLVLDRLSALMLLLTSVLAIPALLYSSARWNKMGQHFHSLFMFLLMGLNGAYLTGDLFNLFVFFEILLAASYGLALHGSGQARVRAGMHYIAINLVASLLFLIGVSLIYGVAGTLNIADLATRIPALPEADRPLFHAAAAILGTAFLVKAAMWPFCFWLPSAYQAAAAPVAAMFAVMTKVGFYVVLRLSSLLFWEGSGWSAGFGAELLMIGGLATLAYGTLGVLASQGLSRMAGFSVIISAGTLLTSIGIMLTGGGVGMLAGALYYMVSSTLAVSCFFLLIELIERGQGSIATVLALTADMYGIDDPEDGETDPGIAIPATMTVLGIAFAACTVLLAGLPPLSGFVGKVTLLSGMLNPVGLWQPSDISWFSFSFLALVILSGLATLVAMVRVGIHTFWTSADDAVPKVLAVEIVPVAMLLSLTVGLTVMANPAMRYMEATARALNQPQVYIQGVIFAERVAESGPEAETGAAPEAGAADIPATVTEPEPEPGVSMEDAQ